MFPVILNLGLMGGVQILFLGVVAMEMFILLLLGDSATISFSFF